MTAKRTAPSTLTQVVGGNIARLRKARSWSLRDVAEGLAANGWPIVHSAVFKIESGQRVVAVDELAALGATFGVDPWSLTSPLPCETCLGSPPKGFTCNDCGRIGAAA